MTKEEKALFDMSQYKNITAQEVAEKLQKDVDAYKEKVKEISDTKVLEEEEKELIDLLNANDEYMKGVTYKLPSKCEFEGKSYTRAAVATKIVYFLSRIEQTWQYVLGLHQLVQVWKETTSKTITHGALDSTLRILDQQKFKGDSEWTDILIVNEYMKSMHEEYAKNIVVFTALSQFHNAVIEQRDLIEKVPEQNA